MSKFKVGDKVRFVDQSVTFNGNFTARRNERTIGTVVNLETWSDYVDVDWNDGRGYRDGRGESSETQLEAVFRVGETYKWTRKDRHSEWFKIKLTTKLEDNEFNHFRGTVVDKGTFYTDTHFMGDYAMPEDATHVNIESLSEIEPEEIKTVNETKLPSFLVHADDVLSRVLYPFHAESTAVRDAEGKVVFHVSGEDTSNAQDIELAQFFVDAINEKIERDKN